MIVGLGFSPKQAVNKNGVADHNRHAGQGDDRHDLKRVKPGGAAVVGRQAQSRIIGGSDQIGELSVGRGRPSRRTSRKENIMKKHLWNVTLIVVWLAAGLLLPQQTCADPPQDLSLRYDTKAQTLSVSITHKSTFTGFHYIKQVQIKRNDEPFGIQKYDSQTGKTTFVYTYKVPAKPNDLLEVTANCNIQGQKTATLKVE